MLIEFGKNPLSLRMTLKLFCPFVCPDAFKLRKRINKNKMNPYTKMFDFMQLDIKTGL